jgi:hypothetical protein
MREIRSYGSVRGVRSNPYPYRDIPLPVPQAPSFRRSTALPVNQRSWAAIVTPSLSRMGPRGLDDTGEP